MNAGNKVRDTALHTACQRGHEAVARALVLLGADVNAPNALGLSPFHLSIDHAREALLKNPNLVCSFSCLCVCDVRMCVTNWL